MAAETSYPIAEEPFDIGPWRVAHADDTGVVGSANGTDRSLYFDSGGMRVFRRAGSRKIQGIHAVHDEEKQLTVPDNATGSTRYDRVVDRLLADGTITTVLKTGTTSPPTLTQTPGGTWEESLGSFPVPAGATNLTPLGNAITDERRFLPRRVTPVASEALRPASPLVGDEVDFPDGTRQRWTGSTWEPLSTPWTTYAVTWNVTSGTAPSLGGGTLVGRWRRTGPRTVAFRIVLYSASGTTFGNNPWVFSLPVAALGDIEGGFTASAVAVNGAGVPFGCDAFTPAGSASALYVGHASGPVRESAPFTWGDNCRLTISGSYETAT